MQQLMVNPHGFSLMANGTTDEPKVLLARDPTTDKLLLLVPISLQVPIQLPSITATSSIEVAADIHEPLTLNVAPAPTAELRQLPSELLNNILPVSLVSPVSQALPDVTPHETRTFETLKNARIQDDAAVSASALPFPESQGSVVPGFRDTAPQCTGQETVSFVDELSNSSAGLSNVQWAAAQGEASSSSVPSYSGDSTAGSVGSQPSNLSEKLFDEIPSTTTGKQPAHRLLDCPHCEQSFRRKFSLKTHLSTHSRSRPYQCVVCGKAFRQNSHVHSHMQSHKNETTKQLEFICPYCELPFDKFHALRAHLVDHCNQKQYLCPSSPCQGLFNDLSTYIEHVQTHPDLSYRCQTCEHVSSSLEQAGRHQHQHIFDELDGTEGRSGASTSSKDSVPSTLHCCPLCPHRPTFGRSSDLRRHLARQHSEANREKWECSKCGIRCYSAFNLKKHERTHKPTSERATLKCPLCNAHFSSKFHLNRHLSTHSEGAKFVCNICNKAVKRKDHLSQHMRHAHGIGRNKDVPKMDS